MNPSPDSPKVGRPRKWANDAERQRHYRQRRAIELAGPLKLREDLREARRQLNGATQTIRRRDRELAELKRGHRLLAEQHGQLERRLARAQDDLERLRRQSAASPRPNTADQLVPPPPFGATLSRQQRRAEERRRRKGS